MHDDHRTETKPHAIHAQKGGGAGKWLIGAAAAAVLVGGGYMVWKNSGTGASDQTAQAAYEQQYSDLNADGTVRAQPLPAGEPSAFANPEFSDDAPAAMTPASSSTTRSTAARRATTTRTAQAQAVPEETIGVTPASITTDEADIVVPAPRRPVWTSTPNARRLTALYPQRALERGREGEARLNCTIMEAGRLDCARVSETPGGFGAAAVRVAHAFRHATTTADGRSAVGTPVNLRVVFRIEEDRRRG